MYLLKTVCVIGLGYVGLPTAAVIASAGHRVWGVDISVHTLSTLGAGKSTIDEPDVKELVERELASGRLTVSPVPVEADIFIVCVPTPVTADKTVDLSLVESATRSLLSCVKRGDMVILESTSPIGTTRRVMGRILGKTGLDIQADLDLCYCPERVFPGNSLKEIVYNNRVVGGVTPRAMHRAREFYKSFCKGQVAETNAEAAEFSKLAENSFRDVNIALANSFARMAEHAGIDIGDVLAIANQHPRVNIHQPGAGVGGHCIPVDPWFLIEAYPEASKLLSEARAINDGQPTWLLDRAEQAGLTPGSRIAILGLAYRGDIDDARESPAELLIEVALARGYSLTVQDPRVEERHLHLDKYRFERQVGEAVKGCEAVFVMTDHTDYKSLATAELLSGGAAIVVDGRRLLQAEDFAHTDVTLIQVGCASRQGSARFAAGIAGE